MKDDKTYKGELTARTYHPAYPNGRTLIHVHGGGFMKGGIEQVSPWCEYLAKNGWEVVALAYRSNETSTIEDAIQDIGDAMRWWSDLNPRKQAHLCGNSAGAYLVAWLCIFDMVPFQVPSCIMFCPVTDIRTRNSHLNFSNRKTRRRTEADRQRLSIINHVDKKIDTRFLITHGRNDTIVPFQNSVDFYDRLRVNNDCRFLPDDGGHPCWNKPENLPITYMSMMEFIG